MKSVLLTLVFAACSATAQTNPAASTNEAVAVSNFLAPAATATNQGIALAEQVEAVRAVCIENRRLICGKILKVLPDGIVVDSGYTNLVREPLNKSWLIPGTATATRATNLVEEKKPDAICIGLVFLTNLPKTPGAKPKAFDYVCLEGFPMGQSTYTSVGDLQRTVRRFTTKIANSVRWNFETGVNPNVPGK
ncbi:MAG: hypothetical protein RL616_1817 [Verrucomicrobiota bacterium]|jgi:hypothetical protein